MKWQTLALGLFAATGLASPVLPVTKATYKLRLTAKEKSLNNKYLTLNGTTLGVYRRAQEVEFYPVPSPETGKLEMRRADGKDQEALALIGSPDGLMDLSSIANPDEANFPGDTTCDYKSFTLEGETLDYAAGKKGGAWVAFPAVGGRSGEWSVKWKDPNAWTIQNFMVVDIVYEPVMRAQGGF